MRGQGIAAQIKDAVFSDLFVEQFDLAGRPGIDAVENRVHQRTTIAVNRQHAWPDRTGCDRVDLVRINFRTVQEGPGYMDEIVPPILVRTVFSPAGTGNDQLVRPGGSSDDLS